MENERILKIQGQLRARSRLNEIEDGSWTRSRLHGLDCTTLCIGGKQFPSDGNRENPLSGKDYTGEVVPFEEVCMERNNSEDGSRVIR